MEPLPRPIFTAVSIGTPAFYEVIPPLNPFFRLRNLKSREVLLFIQTRAWTTIWLVSSFGPVSLESMAKSQQMRTELNPARVSNC